MNEDSATPAAARGPFLPLLLLALSIVLIFSFQLYVISAQHSAFEAAILRQGDGVKQSKAIQSNLEKLVRDLLEAAPTDSDAKALITKYGIQSAGGVPAPSAAASPSK